MAARARLTFIFPSGGKARGVESINFFRTCSCKADSNAVGRWRFTVARMCNNKGWLFATIKYPAIAKRAEVIDAKRTEDSIVKSADFSTSDAPMKTWEKRHYQKLQVLP